MKEFNNKFKENMNEILKISQWKSNSTSDYCMVIYCNSRACQNQEKLCNGIIRR